jgi:hypothetical protein
MYYATKYRSAKNTINEIERPKYLCREKKDDGKVEKPKKSVKVDALIIIYTFCNG